CFSLRPSACLRALCVNALYSAESAEIRRGPQRISQTISTLATAHGLFGGSDRRLRRAPLHLLPATSSQGLDTTPRVLLDTRHYPDRVLWQQLARLPRHAAYVHRAPGGVRNSRGNEAHSEQPSPPTQRDRARLSARPARVLRCLP